MAVLGSVNEKKDGSGFIVKFDPHKKDGINTLTLNRGDALFLENPLVYVDNLVSAGIITAEQGAEKKSKIPSFIKYYITGVGVNKN